MNLFRNKKTKIIFLTTSGKKICNIKFSKEQFNMIEKAAEYNNQTVEQFFHDLLKELTNHVKKDIKR
jgi:uncharacterized protein (DUF1778 family)